MFVVVTVGRGATSFPGPVTSIMVVPDVGNPEKVTLLNVSAAGTPCSSSIMRALLTERPVTCQRREVTEYPLPRSSARVCYSPPEDLSSWGRKEETVKTDVKRHVKRDVNKTVGLRGV